MEACTFEYSDESGNTITEEYMALPNIKIKSSDSDPNSN